MIMLMYDWRYIALISNVSCKYLPTLSRLLPNRSCVVSIYLFVFVSVFVSSSKESVDTEPYLVFFFSQEEVMDAEEAYDEMIRQEREHQEQDGLNGGSDGETSPPHRADPVVTSGLRSPPSVNIALQSMSPSQVPSNTPNSSANPTAGSQGYIDSVPPMASSPR